MLLKVLAILGITLVILGASIIVITPFVDLTSIIKYEIDKIRISNLMEDIISEDSIPSQESIRTTGMELIELETPLASLTSDNLTPKDETKIVSGTILLIFGTILLGMQYGKGSFLWKKE